MRARMMAATIGAFGFAATEVNGGKLPRRISVVFKALPHCTARSRGCGTMLNFCKNLCCANG